MYFVSFSTIRVFEHTDPRAFEQQVGRWLMIREAENINLLSPLPVIIAMASQSPQGSRVPERLFTIEDGGALLGVGILFTSGCLCLTWSTDIAIITLAEFMAKARCAVGSVFAPSHVSMIFSEKWAELTGQRFELDRSERVYQLTRCTYAPPATGKLELAVESDMPLLEPWARSFVQETQYEADLTPEQLALDLTRSGSLYLWKNPTPVSMAAWMSPTPNGGSINFVFTPAELRGHGHAKAVVAALGTQMLSRGRKYCFILTDTQDVQTHSLYHAVGARTLCELLRCTIHSKNVDVSRNAHPQIHAPARPIAI